MTARTYYLASSSRPEGVEAAKALAARLDPAGLVCAFPWWEHLNDPCDQWSALASLDLEAAVSSDVFVMLAGAGESVGAHVELGARLGAELDAYVLDADKAHPLFRLHRCVRALADVDALLAALAPCDECSGDGSVWVSTRYSEDREECGACGGRRTRA